MLLKIVEEWLAMRGVWRPIYIIDGIINKNEYITNISALFSTLKLKLLLYEPYIALQKC